MESSFKTFIFAVKGEDRREVINKLIFWVELKVNLSYFSMPKVTF